MQRRNRFIRKACYLLICLVPILVSAQTHEQTLLITDFETGNKQLGSGVELTEWHHPEKHLSVEIGTVPLTEAPSAYGSYAAQAVFTPKNKRINSWSGGGIVVVFPVANLQEWDSLEFDMRSLSPADQLSDVRVKLESRGNCHSIELKLSDFGFFPTVDWTHVSIPLKAFKHNTCASDGQSFSLAAVEKFVTVNVRDDKNPGLAGTLLIDNLMITKFVREETPDIRFPYITSFKFDSIPQKLREEGEPFTITGTYQAEIEDPLKLNAFLCLIDEHLDGVYVQTWILFYGDNTWESRVYPGKHIKGVMAYEATNSGRPMVEKHQMSGVKLPESLFSGTAFVKIKRYVFR